MDSRRNGVFGAKWEDSHGRFPCPGSHVPGRIATPTRGEVLKQGINLSFLLLHILSLIKPKGKITIKKTRKIKPLPGAEQRREGNGSGQDTQRITRPNTITVSVGWLNKFHRPQLSITFTSFVIPGTFYDPNYFTLFCIDQRCNKYKNIWWNFVKWLDKSGFPLWYSRLFL